MEQLSQSRKGERERGDHRYSSRAGLRVTIYRASDKALEMGVNARLKNRYHRSREPVITEVAKAKPLDHELAAGVEVPRSGDLHPHPCPRGRTWMLGPSAQGDHLADLK